MAGTRELMKALDALQVALGELGAEQEALKKRVAALEAARGEQSGQVERMARQYDNLFRYDGSRQEEAE